MCIVAIHMCINYIFYINFFCVFWESSASGQEYVKAVRGVSVTAPLLLADYVTTGKGRENGVHCSL